jgi:hypothetical protein
MDIFAPDRARPNIKRTGTPLLLHVKPLPPEGKPAGEVAVGRFKLNAKLDRNQALAGDALTLTAVVQGEGNIRTVQVAPPKLPNVEVLQPEVKDLVEAPNDLLTGTREYRWLIVPREPGHLTIPPLTLASFDPRSQKYQQVQSSPLAIDVVGQAAARSATTPAPAQPNAVAPDGQDHEAHKWAPIRTQSELQRSYARFAERPIYPWLLLLPGLGWLAVVSTSLVRRRIAARGETASGRAMREAAQRLAAADAAASDGDAAGFHAAASAALIAVLDARMGEPVSGFTRAQLREHLHARGMDQAGAAAVTSALERHEFARFGSGAASLSELASQQAALRTLFERIAEFTPRGAEDAA